MGIVCHCNQEQETPIEQNFKSDIITDSVMNPVKVMNKTIDHNTFTSINGQESLKRSKHFESNNYVRKPSSIPVVQNTDASSSIRISKLLKFQNILEATRNVNDGFCVQHINGGHVFKGYFVNGRANGLGKFIFANGDEFTGYFEENLACGYGYYSIGDGLCVMEGFWKNDVLEGVGIEKWKDGSVYEGSFRKNVKDGIGFWKWTSDEWAKGEFADNCINGIVLK